MNRTILIENPRLIPRRFCDIHLVVSSICGWLLVLFNLGFAVTVFESSAIAMTDRIVAIVEDETITLSELQQRKKMMSYFNGVKSLSSEQDKHYANMMLQSMIDDEAMEQYAKKVEIAASDSEVNEFIKNIETNSKMQPGQLVKAVKDLNVQEDVLRKLLHAQVVRNKIIREVLSRNINVTQDDVESLILSTNSRDAILNLKVFTAKNDKDRTYKSMNSLNSRIKGCKNLNLLRYQPFAELSAISTKLSALSPDMQNLVKNMKIGETSGVVKDDGMRIFLLCEKNLDQMTMEDNNSVANFLGNKKLNLKARKFFQDLRKKAYVKVMM